MECDSIDQPLISLFFGVFLLGIITDGFHTMVLLRLWPLHGQREESILFIIFFLGITGLFFGWYWWVGHKLKLDLHTPLSPVLFALFGGAYGGSAAVALIGKSIFSAKTLWILGSPWFLQTFFMVFTAVSVVHLKSQ